MSQRIKQLENLFGQPLLVRTVPPHPTEQGQKLLALLHQVELLEEQWLGDENSGSTPLLLSLAVNADSLATWFLPALNPVLGNSPIRLNIQVEDETRTQERLRRGEVVGAISIQPQALPGCLVDKLGALDYIFVASPGFAAKYFRWGDSLFVIKSACGCFRPFRRYAPSLCATKLWVVARQCSMPYRELLRGLCTVSETGLYLL